MFKIGEFSKLAQISVPTLRYYDQVGLLTPEVVDRATGYRYYAANQLARLHRILVLKGLGLSLQQISGVLAEGLTLEEIRGMLRLRQVQIRQELVEMQSQLVTVEARLRQIEREEQLPSQEVLSSHDVLLKHVPAQLVASVRAILPTHSAIGTLFFEVYEAIGERAAEALGPHPGEAGQTLILWYDTEHKGRDVDGAAAFALRCRVLESGRMRLDELPAATMAATIHHGPYDTLGHAHQAVLTWIDANHYRVVGPDREVCLFNKMPIRQDDPSYVTEIQYPVEKLVANQAKRGPR